MTESNIYLLRILEKYKAKDLSLYSNSISQLKISLVNWASSCYLNILDSGSRAKGTAISLASDVDYVVSLTSNCNANNGGLKSCYDSLFLELNNKYGAANIRKQNVSVRLNLNGLEVDVTPARQQSGYTHYHSLYVSKTNSWTQTNIQKHIADISQCGRTNEIKILKIWRQLHGLDFPSIYLEYLLVNNILLNQSKDINNLHSNVWLALNKLAKTEGNPLYSRIIDPANSNNILSDLLTSTEKTKIITQAQATIKANYWSQVVW